ncbi:MAG: hypothetical protein P8X96_21865 [Desulfobacteraceae bacterium]
MTKILHLLRSVPDDTVAQLIATMGSQEGATVVCLYPDDVTHDPVDWHRLIADIMSHDTIICWW